jgi:hypothetical protein
LSSGGWECSGLHPPQLIINAFLKINTQKEPGRIKRFATEKANEQMSDLDDSRPAKDTICFGLVQGFEEMWVEWSQAEIERLKPKT